MKRLGVSLALLLIAAFARAHPGVGIVRDRAGNVYFTDLKQVWRVTPEGRMSVAVPNVHTHELCFDTAGNLLGEHLWYEGDATRKWNQRLWRLSPAGEVSDIVKARPAFQEGDSFVRDGAGAMYWASHGPPVVIRKATPNGLVSTHAAAAGLMEVGRMTATPEGVLFLMDQGDLRRVSADGKVTTLVSKVSSMKRPPPNVRQAHYHQGLWTDGDRNVYVAVSEEAVVMRVRPGAPAEIVKSTGPGWSPSGGLIDRDHRLWILEYRADNAVRVLRVEKDGSETIFDPAAPAR
jgi:hypothetical protein